MCVNLMVMRPEKFFFMDMPLPMSCVFQLPLTETADMAASYDTVPE